MVICQLSSSGTQAYLYSVMYYDSNGRVIQTKSSNQLQNGVEKEYVAYDFVGHPLKRKHIHAATGKTTQTEVYEYSYDQAGRLLTATHQLNGASKVTLTANRYDEVGRLVSNERNGISALKTEYTYNVRSWMKDIKGPLFTQILYYNDKRANKTNEASYNGNISAMDWKAGDKQRGYDFVYDALSRITGARYLEGGARNNNFDTSYSYDGQGNMLTLTRRGNVGTTTYDMVDNLTMNYVGNQLVKVEDTGAKPSLSMSMDFKNGAGQDVEYSYDGNGNMVKDLNKEITKIEYNVLNLPQRITFTGANNPLNEYIYSAGRKKLAVIHKASSEKRTDYVGNMIYENGTLKRILVDGGFIENGTYHFFLQDHLGNNRVVAKADGAVVQTNHYYPYGTSFAEGMQTSNQPYKYNGKELDSENGLILHDYGNRLYDSSLGRFITLDRFSAKYYSLSPYQYAANNPINNFDINGDSIWYTLKDNIVTMNVTAKLFNNSGDGRINMSAAARDIASSIKQAFEGDFEWSDGKTYSLEVNMNLSVAKSMDDVSNSDHLFVLANSDGEGARGATSMSGGKVMTITSSDYVNVLSPKVVYNNTFTAVHEFGHAAGFGHSKNPFNVMRQMGMFKSSNSEQRRQMLQQKNNINQGQNSVNTGYIKIPYPYIHNGSVKVDLFNQGLK